MSHAKLLESKIITLEGLETICRMSRPLIFTNGCFDLLHRGHVTYLSQARDFGQSLLVAVNTDASVRRLNKGINRPINTLANRMAVLAALDSVDWVVPFDEDTPLELIKKCRPEVLVKGGDWSIESIVGYQEVLSWGGEVYSIPFEYDVSTTQIVNQILGTRR